MRLRDSLRTVINFQLLFPAVVTLIAVILKLAGVLKIPYALIMLPLSISVPVGLVMIIITLAIAYIFGETSR